YLSMAARFAPHEADIALLTAVLANAAQAVEHYVPDSARTGARRRWLDAVWEGMHGAAPGSDAQLAFARASVSRRASTTGTPPTSGRSCAAPSHRRRACVSTQTCGGAGG